MSATRRGSPQMSFSQCFLASWRPVPCSIGTDRGHWHCVTLQTVGWGYIERHINSWDCLGAIAVIPVVYAELLEIYGDG